MLISILIGCYDGSVHGWSGLINADTAKLQLKYAFSAHQTTVKACALSDDGTRGATGSSDESVQLYDLTEMKIIDKMGGVHESTVTSLCFLPSVKSTEKNKDNKKFLLSGDENGRLIVWEDTRSLHELKGHKADSQVSSIAIHPTGNLALSTAGDNSLRMWDLIHVKAAPRKKIQDFKTLSCACWSPNTGEYYAIVGNETNVLVFSIDSEETALCCVSHPKRINQVCFVADVLIATACDDTNVRIIGIDGSLVRTLPGSHRVRSVGACTTSEEDSYLFAAQSDGLINVWDLNADEKQEPICSLHVGTNAHLTCMAVVGMEEKKKKTNKKKLKKSVTE